MIFWIIGVVGGVGYSMIPIGIVDKTTVANMTVGLLCSIGQVVDSSNQLSPLVLFLRMTTQTITELGIIGVLSEAEKSP